MHAMARDGKNLSLRWHIVFRKDEKTYVHITIELHNKLVDANKAYEHN